MTIGENVNQCSHNGEQYGDTLKKIKIELPYNPAIPLLGICLCVLNHFSHIQLFATPWTVARLCPWDFPGNDSGVGCQALLQGIFLMQKLNLCLLCSRIAGGISTAEPLGKSTGHLSEENKNTNQKKICAPVCSLQHYLQQPRYGSNLSAHQEMSR